MASTTGTYTGNAATDRTIPLAFTPKLVVIVKETVSDPMFISNTNTGTYGTNIPNAVAPNHVNANANRPGLTTNGFVVSGTLASMTNNNAAVYYYFASG